jgi:membrane protein implicated in regulation of membrane protease activity
MLLVVAVVLLVVLPSPWNVIAFAVSLVLFLVELLVWNRTVRHRRSVSGAQTLLGQTATVVSACRPSGQVRISGETWAARCEERADAGDSVLVTAVDGLTLVVERSAPVHARPT